MKHDKYRKFSELLSNTKAHLLSGENPVVLQKLKDIEELFFECMEEKRIGGDFNKDKFIEIVKNNSIKKSSLTYAPRTGRITLKYREEDSPHLNELTRMAESLLEVNPQTIETFRGRFDFYDGKWSCQLKTNSKKHKIEL